MEELQQAESDLKSTFTNILLVEDDNAHASIVKRTVLPFVGEVVRVATGKEALNAVETSFFDLVLCDLHLPDMSGIEIIRGIRQLRPVLPIIVLTSSNNLDDAVSAMREGAWDYMIKQFSDDLADTMQLIISRTAERKMQLLRETQLRSERRNFWAAAHAAQDGLAIMGAEGSVVFANSAFHNFCRLIKNGHSSQDTINILELLQQCDKTAAQTLQQKLKEKKRTMLWEAELHIKESEKEQQKNSRYFELSLTSVKFDERDDGETSADNFQEFNRYVMWVRDISRRKEQERFQRDLLSTTSHDLKGPLGAILTSAELLGDDEFLRSGKGVELITRIASCARNSINIIDELLSARRIQDGVLIVKPRWYSVSEILEETVLDYLPPAKSKSIELIAKPLAEDFQIWADRIGLNRVLGNLVSNAIKFTPAGGTVELSATKAVNEVRISVRDTGTGIEVQARHKLFQRYSRLEKHQEIEGTGLGLFVTKNIVEAHNGTIELQSEVGIGTTFTIVFPLPENPKKAE